MSGWIGFDFDGTLRRLSDGQPAPGMVDRVKGYLAQGIECRIVTARVNPRESLHHITMHTFAIEQWCKEHIGEILPVTCMKDYDMAVLYDDRAIAVETDTGLVKGWMEFVEV